MSETKLISGLPRRVANASPHLAAIQPPEPNLTDDELKVIVYVARSPNCSRHEIACSLFMSPKAMEAAVRGLEKKGLIERQEDWA